FIPIIVKWRYGAEVNKSVWWSIALAFIGVLLVMKPNSGIFSLYSLAGLLSGFFMALSSTMSARVVAEGAKISLLVFYFLILASIFSGLLFLGFNGLYKNNLPVIFNQFFHMP